MLLGLMGSESLLKKNKVLEFIQQKIKGEKRIQWQPEHDKVWGGEGRGCAQVFAGHHNKHPSSPIPKCCSRLVGDKYSSPTSLSSSNPFWVLPYPCLNFATVYDFDLRDEDLKNTYFTRLNLFLSF